MSAPTARAEGRLDRIIARGHLVCGLHAPIPGFAVADGRGSYRGFEADFCRAIAAAILGSGDKVAFVPADTVDQFKGNPDIDIAVRRLTWTLSREGTDGLIFGPIMFYDGQGFLVRRRPGTAGERAIGPRVCVQPGEGADLALADYARRRGLTITMVALPDWAEIEKALFGGRCDALSADVSLLAGERLKAPDPSRFVLLDEQFTKEPLAPLLRAGDDGFFQVVRWTIFATMDAEELGISSTNLDTMRQSRDPETRRLLGLNPGNGKALGLRESWAYDVIRSVGNYGEIFERNLGAGSPIKLARGLNRLWTHGGLIYAPPAR